MIFKIKKKKKKKKILLKNKKKKKKKKKYLKVLLIFNSLHYLLIRFYNLNKYIYINAIN